ncbi:alkaline phosphatase D family protein [Oligoflexus tunisiensis]|uniref:alkaline phosphatase D family protein n=1 Tax=Oligoflexus tunisiensis TaxID=708132 RepID=UPI00114CC2C8|nr:alkaline phosphatase D family protein [Oligoflexus tunisiensis]
MSFHRRSFIKTLGFAFSASYTISLPKVLFAESSTLESDRYFPCSIASGDPTPQGVILWTRLNPDVIQDPEEPLYFQVATDASFRNVLYLGTVAGNTVQASYDFTVKVDLDEKPEARLQPGTRYYYRFIYRGVSSRIGRCKTAPAPDQNVDHIRYALITCQDYSCGYFHAFDALANEDLDFVIHVGDFIYEYAQYPDMDDHTRRVDIPNSVALSLDDYRTIYKTYRRDRSLQRAMENHTWIITADDHETADNAAWNYEKDTLSVTPAHPYFEAGAAALSTLKLAAQKAWTEYVPARVQLDENASHPFAFLKIYRKFQFGNLAELFMTDTRSYRTPQVDSMADAAMEATDDPASHTMLGAEQRSWLVNGMAQSKAHWKLWGNQTLLSQFGVLERISHRTLMLLAGYDAWDGYHGERQKVLRELKNRGVRNLFVLTGDLHTYLSSFVKINYNKASNSDQDNVVGFELMTPSITSANFALGLQLSAKAAPGGKKTFLDRVYNFVGSHYTKGWLAERIFDDKLKLVNPHFTDFGAIYYGYTLVSMDREKAEWHVYHIDKDAPTPQQAGKKLVRAQRYYPSSMRVEDIKG